MTKELNLPCRYRVFLNFTDNTYFFVTDTGAEYEILFTDGSALFSTTALECHEVYNIIINKIRAGTGRRDPEIAVTIEAVLEHFFSHRNRILIYTCDSADLKHLLRNRLFNSWFAKSHLKNSIVKLDHQFDNQDPVYFSSMIFHKEIDIGYIKINQVFKEVTNILSESK